MLDNNNQSQALPGNLQQRVENALNLITDSESEVARLQKLSVIKKDEINKIYEEKKYIEGQIADANVNLQGYKDAIEDCKKTLAMLSHQENDLRTEMYNITASVIEAKSKLDNIKTETESRQIAADALDENISKRHADLSAKEAVHAQKVARLQDALK